MKSLIRYALVGLTLAFCLSSCTDQNQSTPSVLEPISIGLNKPQPPPTPANPTLTFTADSVFGGGGAWNQNTVTCLYVMDADGSHRKMIYNDYIKSGNSISIGSVEGPRWSGNGQQICFSGRVYYGTNPLIRPLSSYNSISTLTVTLVNGVPTASNVTKILDGAVNSTGYSNPAWSPSANEIAVKAWPNGNPQKLQVVASSGGTPVTLFTCPSTGYDIKAICYSPDGSKIAFLLKNTATNDHSIMIIDRSTSMILNTIALSTSYSSWFDLDWSRTSGSTKLAFRGMSGPQSYLFTLDFSSATTPTQVASDGMYPTWSPADTKLAYVQASTGQGIKVLTLSSSSSTTISTSKAGSLNWKR